MSVDSDEKVELENVTEIIDRLTHELRELYEFRDLFFENHPLELATEKNKLVEEKKKLLVEKFEAIDVDTQIPFSMRAQFLYLKGRCYNISPVYDSKASQCLSKSVKLNPSLGAAWNELGECYWKNMNVKDAKASFEGALKHERNRLSLRCLSIILRQESGNRKRNEATALFLNSVEMAKEAVAQDIKDGTSWMVLGNAYLCQFFTVAQDPATLKLCMSAYKQAWLDPIARGQPDLYYNKGIALKYEEIYNEALQNFDHACRLDPLWEPPQLERTKLANYLKDTNELVRTRGKLKTKRLTQLVQSMDKKMLGAYSPGTFHTFGSRRDVTLELCKLDNLVEGVNEGKVVLGRVVGSIHNENAVPFTFAIVDESLTCVCVTVYNWADGRGAIIGDCVTIPEPYMTTHKHESDLATYNFNSLRLNNPMLLLVNGKRVGRNQFACTRVTSTYELH
ncbi:Tetratricopeptide repeat protein 5 [Papilio xuthus]|uniref:Tetratricopeptide repeat protein 5 n=1 Tax=Papilio xuthus TaxID=66420 RepID=A0A194PXX8_PAPXU|nr:Tetratricopeptide repeat protein 5 [Papilio xuthus]